MFSPNTVLLEILLVICHLIFFIPHLHLPYTYSTFLLHLFNQLLFLIIIFITHMCSYVFIFPHLLHPHIYQQLIYLRFICSPPLPTLSLPVSTFHHPHCFSLPSPSTFLQALYVSLIFQSPSMKIISSSFSSFLPSFLYIHPSILFNLYYSISLSSLAS